MIVLTYACDGPHCKSRAEGSPGRAPAGWLRLRYIPGLLQPPGLKDRGAREHHYCAQTCADADEARRKAHADAITVAHDAITAQNDADADAMYARFVAGR